MKQTEYLKERIESWMDSHFTSILELKWDREAMIFEVQTDPSTFEDPEFQEWSSRVYTEFSNKYKSIVCFVPYDETGNAST